MSTRLSNSPAQALTQKLPLWATCMGIALPLAVLLVPGCSRGSATELTVVQPETLELDGVAWEKQAWEESFDTQLANYFRRSPELADNPSMRGTAVCYSHGSRRRFYWLSPVDDTCHWAMIEFKGNRGSEMTEGIGVPFVELVDTE